MDSELYKEISNLNGKIGKLEGKVDGFGAQIQKIDIKLDNLNVVPYAIFEERIRLTDRKFELHMSRIEKNEKSIDRINERLNIRDNSFTGKLGVFLESSLIKLVGGAIVAAILFFMYMQQMQQIQSMADSIREVTKENQQILKQERIIEKNE